MQIRVNTDNHIEGTERMKLYFKELVATKLHRFEDRITTIEVHFADENSAEKSGPHDIRCTIKAHPAGLQPVAVTAHADNIEKSSSAGIDKLKALLESTFGKLSSN